jgi:preprotein translocase subunit SecE
MSLGSYIKETREEMKHVSWPTRKQVIVYTSVVILLSAILAIYLGVLDYVLQIVISKII